MDSFLDIYNKGINELKKSGIENAEFDVKQILKKFFLNCECTFNCGHYPENDGEIVEFFSLINERKNNVPLQYIIGDWDFYNLTFLVGDGVLIPRQDTEILVDEVLKINTQNKNLLDVCSGSGCIGITIEKNSDIGKVVLLEKSKKAFSFLEKNITFNGSKAQGINDDLMNYHKIANECFDIIVSNPPYIDKNGMNELSAEVKKEPKDALYGGGDGLLFYRYISKHYKKILKDGGFLFFEIGYNQKESVTEILEKNGYKNINCIKDLCGNDRIIKCNK